MPNLYSSLRRFALTTLLGGGGLLSAQAQLGQTVTAATNAAGTYADLGTTGTVITTTSTDDANSAAQNIGFTFGYNKLTFTQFVLNTNGVIRLGSAAPSVASLYLDANVGGPGVDPLQSTSSADDNLIMPFNTDLVSGTGGAEYRVATTGTAGSRVCTIQWKNVADKAGSGANIQQYSNFSFQVKLYESGRIEFVYGTATASTATVNTRDTNVGLKGTGNGAGQLLLAAKPVTAAWNAATFRSSSYGANTFAVSSALLPDAGRTFAFSDPTYCVAVAYTGFPTPYTQNFDGVTAPTLPCGVTVLDVNNDARTWANYNSTSFAASGTNSMRYSYSATGVVGDDWFFTQGLSMTVGKSYQLQFKYRGNGSLTEAMEVKVGNTAAPASQTTTVFTNNNFNSSTYITTAAGSAAGQVLLFTPNTSGVYYFGFHAISPGNQWYIHVDDVQVSEQTAPACPQPTAIVVSGITTTSATVTFSAPNNGTAYTVIYVPKGTTPTTSSPSVQTTTSTATLTGLNQNTSYDVYVQATCGTSGTSATSGPVSFITDCATTTNFPYTETFDGVTSPALPCGISVLDANNDGKKWENISGTANTSPNAMRYTGSNTSSADDWFFTNALSLQVGTSYQLQFKYRTSSATYVQGLEVKAGMATTAAGQTTVVYTNTGIVNTTFATTASGGAPGQVALFTPTASGVYYFGFHAISRNNFGYLYVDDVQITAIPTPACPQPTNLSVSTVTSSGATIAFSAPAATAYTLVYGLRGFNPATAGTSVPATSSPATLTGLTQDTNYDVYIRATCGTAGTSVLTGPISFRTACATTTTFPYLEKFDGVTAPDLPCGITILDANNDGKTWENYNSTTYAASGTNSMRYSYSASGVTGDDWFFTNGMQLQAGDTYQLQFKYRGYGSLTEAMEVKVGTAATGAGQTTTLFTNTNFNSATYTTTTTGTGAGQVSSFTPTTSGVYYFGFHAISPGNQWYIYVDDVQVTRTSLGVCPTPTNIAVNGVTDTQAQVTFSGPSVATTYQVVYVPTGTTPTATSPSTTGTSSPITVTGLSPNTTYDIYVQGTCGSAGQGIQGGPVTITTACATTAVFPYTQNFDGVTAPALPCGITVVDANNDGSTWVNSNDQPSSGANSMRYMPSAINGADDWFFTNALRLSVGKSYQLKFRYRVFSYNYPEKLEVKIGTSTTPASQITTLFSNNNIINNAYVTSASGNAAGQVINFTPTTAGIYFIGFHAISTVNSFSIYVDDLEVTEAPALATKSSVAPGFSAEASPVPFSDHLNLSLNTLKAGPLQLTLHDAVGRVVRETTANVPAGASSLAVPEAGSLPAGMYILTVRQGGNTQVIRVAHE